MRSEAVKRLAMAGLALVLAVLPAGAKKKRPVEPSYAWEAVGPLGLRQPAAMDTLLHNYQRRSIPSLVSDAWACTGNLGAEGINMIWLDRPATSEFFFADAVATWRPTRATARWYNTRIPSTLLSYNTGGGRDNEQNRLRGVFTGNVSKELQFGALIDYLYSKGSYNYQAVSDLSYGFSASYIGQRWQMQAFFNHWNQLNKENGGITDRLYIFDPAELQGGDDKIEAKSIPTRLTNAHSRIIGQQLWMNNRYNVGFWREEQVDDTTAVRTYVPVTAFTWTFDYEGDKHLFLNSSTLQGDEFWAHRYLDAAATNDSTQMWRVANTVGVDLIEGFNRYVPFGLGVYARHEVRRFRQMAPVSVPEGEESLLTPWPEGVTVSPVTTQNRLWAGAQLTRRQGSWFTATASGEVGLLGPAVGDVKLDADAATRLRLRGDSLQVKAFVSFHNVAVPFLLQQYASNHYIWRNDFGKTRRLRFGGSVDVPWSRTRLEVAMENVQNLVYFGQDALPVQHGGSVQVFTARLHQPLRAGILHWDNTVTYQTSSNDRVVSLPRLSVYSNLYLWFRVARVLQVQFGVDCDYYTRYYAPNYEPATMAFCNQHSILVGNYPFMDVYLTMQLKRARFYVMMTHVNQGWMGRNYFSLPYYPLNPRRFQMGVIVDFLN